MKIELRQTPFEPLVELSRYQVAMDERLQGRYGATAIFIGTMRDFSDGETVRGMALEYYPGMTERHLQHIVETAGREWPLLDALDDLIEAANGKPVLVAYWFKHDLSRISERLHKLHISFSRLDTQESIRRWNAGELPVALVHPASAGHGLNLQSGGSTIIWFGLTWSLELYQQTNARLWRQGQTADTVVVQHIITKGTIDGRMLKALSAKDRTQSALIDAVKADLKI